MNTTPSDSELHATSADPLPKVWDEDARIGDMLKGKRGLVVSGASGMTGDVICFNAVLHIVA